MQFWLILLLLALAIFLLIGVALIQRSLMNEEVKHRIILIIYIILGILIFVWIIFFFCQLLYKGRLIYMFHEIMNHIIQYKH